jgi:hypothetical protein
MSSDFKLKYLQIQSLGDGDLDHTPTFVRIFPADCAFGGKQSGTGIAKRAPLIKGS